MARTNSPLRYPGGKSCLKPLLSTILKSNKITRCHYAEPYAGGAGLALSLLYGGYVSNIHINDIDPSIWSFWEAVLNHTDELSRMIEIADLTIPEWRNQQQIQLEEDFSDPVRLGFAAFFLNRTNRSGIITKAGVIGGIEQTGNYKMDCRFNRSDLVRRIQRISRYRSQIHLTKNDAVSFMNNSSNLSPNTFIYIDPPYFNKGSALYTSFYNNKDHADVATAVLNLKVPWMVTYDNVSEIRNLYKQRRQFVFDINYSVQTKRVGTELLVASKGLRLPEDIRSQQIGRAQYRAA